MIQLEFRDVEYVHAIDKWGSVTAAAAALNITQPALSIYINRLEDRLDLLLFDRIGKSFQLTYAGQCLLDDGLQILLLKKGIEERLMGIKDFHEGRIQLGVPVMRGISFLPKLLKEFNRYYPDIQIDLKEAAYGMDLEQELLSGELDIAFCNLVKPQPDIEYTMIKRESVVLFAAENSSCAQQAIRREGFPYLWIDLDSCRTYPFLQTVPHQITTQLCDVVFQDYQFVPLTKITTKNQLTALQLAANGYGLFIAPEYFSFSGTVAHLPLMFSIGKEAPYYTDFVAATRKKARLTPPLRKLIDIAKR